MLVKAVDEFLVLKHLLCYIHVLHRMAVVAISSCDLARIWEKVINLISNFNMLSSRIHHYDGFMCNEGKAPKLTIQVSNTWWHNHLDAAQQYLNIHGNVTVWVKVE